MNILEAPRADAKETLTKAFLKVGKELGITQDELGQIVGRDRTSIKRNGIDPGSKVGELALYLIRIYRGLFALVGGKKEDLRHWMHTENRHIGGVPADRVKSVDGLIHVVEYLDAIRGKV